MMCATGAEWKGTEIAGCRAKPKYPVCRKFEGRSAANVVGFTGCCAAGTNRASQKSRQGRR